MSAIPEDNYVSNRKRLYKVMGKEVDFCATKGKTSKNTGRSVCLVNVKYNGKIIADHIWVNNTKAVQNFDEGDELHFRGTAKTYSDSRKTRKLGLCKCYKYHKRHPGVDKYIHDREQAAKRTR